MLDTDTILNGLIGAILDVAALDFRSMSYTHSTLHCLIITPVMRTTLDFCTVFHTHASRLGLVDTSTHRAIGMSSFLTSTSTLLDLGPMSLADTPLDGLIGTVAHSAELALFLGTVLAAAATLLGEAVTSAGRAAIDILAGLFLGRLRRRRGADFATERISISCGRRD